tara:strand:- start:253 stop:498 length:246 start_codon:yes stop_codon:yes gene_type:complete
LAKTNVTIDISNHILVPKHKLLTEANKKSILDNYQISEIQLPSISIKDPAIKKFDAKVGDVIEISRESQVSGKYKHYRRVV